MDIEAIVKKHLDSNWYGSVHTLYADMEKGMRSALTELAAGYEQKQALADCAHKINVSVLEGRIRQLEMERLPDNFGHAAIQDAIGALEIADHVADPSHASEDDYRAFSEAINGLRGLLPAAQQQKKEGE